jgi:hypothetical protein
MPKEKFQMTRNEIVEALMEEWWDSVEGNHAESLIQEFMDNNNTELIEGE